MLSSPRWRTRNTLNRQTEKSNPFSRRPARLAHTILNIARQGADYRSMREHTGHGLPALTRRFRGAPLALVAICALAAFAVSCSPPHLRGRGRVQYGSEKRRAIVETAARQRGTPYRFGGESPGGFDCSGLVQYVYLHNGITVPRTAGEQYREGRRIHARDVRPGDLLFFQTSSERISHVAIYAGRRRFIHAPRPGKRVGFASLNNRYWNERYRGAVTFLRN